MKNRDDAVAALLLQNRSHRENTHLLEVVFQQAWH